MPNWQLVEEAHHKTLRCIELADCFFGSAIIRILADEAVGADESGNARSCGVGVGKVLRNGIRHEEAQPLGKALVHAYLQSVVGGVASAIWSEGVVFLVEVKVLREGSQKLVDVSGEAGVGQLNAGSYGRGTCPIREASSILRQVASKREERWIHLVGDNVQSWQVSALGTNIGHAYD